MKISQCWPYMVPSVTITSIPGAWITQVSNIGDEKDESAQGKNKEKTRFLAITVRVQSESYPKFFSGSFHSPSFGFCDTVPMVHVPMKSWIPRPAGWYPPPGRFRGWGRGVISPRFTV